MKVNSYDLPSSTSVLSDQVGNKKKIYQDTLERSFRSEDIPSLSSSFFPDLQHTKQGLLNSSVSLSSHKLFSGKVLKILSNPSQETSKLLNNLLQEVGKEVLRESNQKAIIPSTTQFSDIFEERRNVLSKYIEK